MISTSTAAADEDQIRVVIADRADAMRERDAARLTAHYAPQVVKFDLPPPLQYTGPAARDVQALRAWFASHPGERTDYEIRVHGFSSGAILALLAAERGIGIRKLSLLEPPLRVEDTPPPAASGISGEVARLIVTGRRGEAYEHWMRGIGVPGEMIAGMRQSPLWPALEATAHTLIYDS